MPRAKGTPNSRLRCECGRCPTCKHRERDRRIAAGAHVPEKRERAIAVPDALAKPHGGWGSMQACALGGVMSEAARKQGVLFARLNERFAARVAGAIGG